MIYGYCRVSTNHQKITRQITNIKELYPSATFIKELHSKDFGGSLDDPDIIKLCGCSKNSYYKYKKELKETA